MKFSYRPYAPNPEEKFLVGPLGHWCDYVATLPEPGYLIKDFVMGASLQLVTGPATIGRKTWWALAQSLAIASGKTIGGLEPTNKDGLPVMMMELEGGPHAIKRRIDMLCTAYAIDINSAQMRNNFHWYHWSSEPFAKRFSLRDHDDVTWLRDYLDRAGISFLTLDTFAQAFQGDENSAQAMNLAVQNACSLYASGAAVQILHHTRKGSGNKDEDIDESIRGSSVLAGAYRVHHGFRIAGEDKSYMKLTFRSNDAEEAQYKVTWDINKEKGTAKLDLRPWDNAENELPNVEAARNLLELIPPGESVSIGTLNRLWSDYNVDGVLQMFVRAKVLKPDGVRWMRVKGVEFNG